MVGLFLFGYSMISIYVGAKSVASRDDGYGRPMYTITQIDRPFHSTYIVDSFSAYAASGLAAKTLLSRLVGASVPM